MRVPQQLKHAANPVILDAETGAGSSIESILHGGMSFENVTIGRMILEPYRADIGLGPASAATNLALCLGPA